MERSTHQESIKNSAHGPTICIAPGKPVTPQYYNWMKTSVKKLKILEMLKFVSIYLKSKSTIL
jgi:hypothetical protein